MWFLDVVFGARFLERGFWSEVFGARFLERGFWSEVFGARFLDEVLKMGSDEKEITTPYITPHGSLSNVSTCERDLAD
jgi:hypothetical protein